MRVSQSKLMPPAHFRLRPETYDAGIYHIVVNANEYRLPESFSAQDIILDIGSHIGAFAYAALLRGSQRVYAIEAETENYQLSLQNLQPFIEKGYVSVMHKAVWRSDILEPSVLFTGYHQGPFSNKINSGGGSVATLPTPGYQYHDATPLRIETIAFDALAHRVTDGGEKRIRLLKLDCEGAEWPILLTSATLHLVDAICGEYHEIGDQHSNRQAVFSISGYTEYTSQVLVHFLSTQGFQVEYYSHGRQNEALGMFFAKCRGSQHREHCL